jgi:hypothetical protein
MPFSRPYDQWKKSGYAAEFSLGLGVGFFVKMIFPVSEGNA